MCLGKHIGILELKKLVSFLVVNYDVGNTRIPYNLVPSILLDQF